MTEPADAHKRSPKKTERCPDCGAMFAPQGIKLHRVRKHSAPAATPSDAGQSTDATRGEPAKPRTRLFD